MQDGDEKKLRIPAEDGARTLQEAGVVREEARDGQAGPLGRASLLAETLSAAPAGVSPSPRASPPGDRIEGSAFPVPGWDRYLHLGFLGQGGMGRVFLAYDPRLRRNVALKFVRDDHPELTRRFLSEARAQAKVNHERVCKVYEVGQVEQKLFIAMQYVEGQPLGALTGELTVEQKALVLREAALGVHEAHRVGLIHRDIKPSNILVERGEDGVPRPYVMDFGLARDWKEGVTVTGAVLGTPHYMAPEQARGEVARLDRRADVYSLGATLYALLTGEPPIQGSNGLEVINNLATVDPRPPRALDRNIPSDLEAITLKCLEKEPSARYDSARALAEDLDRFLAGEPVLARTGPGYRVRKWLRKHRLMVTAATAALLAVAVAVGWGVRARNSAAERERLARHFTELVERIESRTRYSALSRLHDARDDRQAIKAIQAQMEELEAELRQGGEQVLGPGHYALGRGALALGDTEKAREHLELAWHYGFHEPKAAYALGLALGQPYQQQLLEVEKIRDDTERREARRREIERRYRDPALTYLKQSQGAEEPSAEYIAALIAFYEGRLDDALARLEAVSASQPWLYEAPKLRGDIFVVRFYKRWREKNLDEAKADLEAGRKAYAAAATIAESVPAVHLGMAQLEGAEMNMQLFKSRAMADAMPSYTRAQEALTKCLAVAPDDYMCWVELARLHVRLAVWSGMTSDELSNLIMKAGEAAERAMALAPERREARMVLADGFSVLARDRFLHGEDPREQFRKAADLLESVRPEDRDLSLHAQSGGVFMNWAGYTPSSAENPLGCLDKSIQSDRAIQEYQAALAIDDRMSDVWLNLGNLYFWRALDPCNSGSAFDWVQGTLAYERARSLNPRSTDTYQGAGSHYQRRARQLRNRGGDPIPDLMRAVEQYQQGLAVEPDRYGLYLGMGEALREQARAIWESGGDPFPLLDQAREALERALNSERPDIARTLYDLATLFAQRASYLRARGEDPGPSLREAEERAKRVVEYWRGDPDPVGTLGWVHYIQAGFNVDRGRAPGPALARAEEELRHALALEPASGVIFKHEAEAWLHLGQVQTLRARWQALHGRARDEDFEEATKSYEKALKLEPDELDYLLRLGQHCATWATWRKQAGGEHGGIVKRGLELADRILKVRPDWTEAQALRASLLQVSQ